MEQPINQDELLSSLKTLVSMACSSGNVGSEMDADGVTVKIRFDKSIDGNLDLARSVAALLAQEMM